MTEDLHRVRARAGQQPRRPHGAAPGRGRRAGRHPRADGAAPSRRSTRPTRSVGRTSPTTSTPSSSPRARTRRARCSSGRWRSRTPSTGSATCGGDRAPSTSTSSPSATSSSTSRTCRCRTRGPRERAFVLVPWLDVDAAAALPGSGPVAALLEQPGHAPAYDVAPTSTSSCRSGARRMRPTRVATLFALLVGTAALAWGVLQISVEPRRDAAAADLDRSGRRRRHRRGRAADGAGAAVAAGPAGEATAPAGDGPAGGAGQGERPRRPAASAGSTPATWWRCCPGWTSSRGGTARVICLVALLAAVALSAAGLMARAALPGAAVRRRRRPAGLARLTRLRRSGPGRARPPRGRRRVTSDSTDRRSASCSVAGVRTPTYRSPSSTATQPASCCSISANAVFRFAPTGTQASIRRARSATVAVAGLVGGHPAVQPVVVVQHDGPPRAGGAATTRSASASRSVDVHDRRVLEVGRVDRGDREPLEPAVGADEARRRSRSPASPAAGRARRTARGGRPRRRPRCGRPSAPPRRGRG